MPRGSGEREGLGRTLAPDGGGRFPFPLNLRFSNESGRLGTE